MVKQVLLLGENYQDDISGFTIANSSLVNNIMERFIPFSVHHLSGESDSNPLKDLYEILYH